MTTPSATAMFPGSRRGNRMSWFTTIGLATLSILLSGCSSQTVRSDQLVGEQLNAVRFAMLSLSDVDVEWQGLMSDSSEIDPRIAKALADLERCAGPNAPSYLTAVEPTVQANTLVGTIDGVDAQFDSYAYVARSNRPVIFEESGREIDCLGAFVRERIAAALNNDALDVTDAEVTVLPPLNGASSVQVVRFDLSVTNGTQNISVASTLFTATSGPVTVFYDLGTIGGPPSETTVERYRKILEERMQLLDGLF